MATVREGVMKKEVLDENYKGEVIRHDVAKYVPETDYVVKVIDRHVEKAKHNLKGAPIVVAGGYGVGSKENFNLLFDLAKELHAEVGRQPCGCRCRFLRPRSSDRSDRCHGASEIIYRLRYLRADPAYRRHARRRYHHFDQ